jgi:acyl-CoA thioester hydrolase
MKEFIKKVDVRWSDLDPNVHLRHSVYYDWGAFCRVAFFQEHQLTTETMAQLRIGPILFREECVFRKEIRLGDKVTIDLQLVKAKRDFSRWTIQHTIMKNGDSVAAILTVDGAWMDVVRRKLATPPQEVVDTYLHMTQKEDFQWVD